MGSAKQGPPVQEDERGRSCFLPHRRLLDLPSPFVFRCGFLRPLTAQNRRAAHDDRTRWWDPSRRCWDCRRNLTRSATPVLVPTLVKLLDRCSLQRDGRPVEFGVPLRADPLQ